MGELPEWKGYRAGWQKSRRNWPVSSEEKPEMAVLPTQAQGRAGCCKSVDAETGAEGDTHYVIYTSVIYTVVG